MVPTVPVRVVLVDDVADMRVLVRTALELRGGFEIVGEAASGNQAVEVAGIERPDVVVLDLGLPDLAGEEVITRLRAIAPGSQVVVFTGADLRDVDGVRATVAGLVRKDTDVGFLVDTLEAVSARPARQAAEVFPARLESAGAARAFLEARWREWQLGAGIDDPLLVVSELVTNAVTHAASECALRLLLSETGLRIEVGDGSSASPDPLAAAADDEHGRGLFLVAALSSAWGVEASAEGGKVVWAELPVSPAPA
jgi:DNA-binding response OmpR family regulator